MRWVALTFVGLTVIHTWPLATDLPHLSRVDNADTELNAWAVSWIAHRLPRDPLHLFDANIFFPERYTQSGYLAVFVAVALGAALLARADRWVPRDRVQLSSHLALAGVVAVVGSGVVLWPYAVADQGGPLRRSIEDVVLDSATLRDYLTTAGRLHYGIWSHRFYELGRDALFPGITGLGLCVVALRVRNMDRARVRVLVVVGLVGLILSFGPATPLYGWLFAIFPPLQSIRAASRFGYLFLLAVAALAGLGAAALRKRGANRVGMTAAVIACIVLANLEALRAPMSFVRFGGFSPIYRMIAEAPDVEALAEFPLWPSAAVARNGQYVLASTEHWKPLLNGYSGFVPPSYADASNRLAGFPAPDTIELLRDIGVTHVVVHPALYDPDRAAQVLAAVADQRELGLMAVDGQGSRLYRVATAED